MVKSISRYNTSCICMHDICPTTDGPWNTVDCQTAGRALRAQELIPVEFSGIKVVLQSCIGSSHYGGVAPTYYEYRQELPINSTEELLCQASKATMKSKPTSQNLTTLKMNNPSPNPRNNQRLVNYLRGSCPRSRVPYNRHPISRPSSLAAPIPGSLNPTILQKPGNIGQALRSPSFSFTLAWASRGFVAS